MRSCGKGSTRQPEKQTSPHPPRDGAGGTEGLDRGGRDGVARSVAGSQSGAWCVPFQLCPYKPSRKSEAPPEFPQLHSSHAKTKLAERHLTLVVCALPPEERDLGTNSLKGMGPWRPLSL